MTTNSTVYFSLRAPTSIHSLESTSFSYLIITIIRYDNTLKRLRCDKINNFHHSAHNTHACIASHIAHTNMPVDFPVESFAQLLNCTYLHNDQTLRKFVLLNQHWNDNTGFDYILLEMQKICRQSEKIAISFQRTVDEFKAQLKTFRNKNKIILNKIKFYHLLRQILIK